MKWEAKYNKRGDAWELRDHNGIFIGEIRDEQTAKLIAAAPELKNKAEQLIKDIKKYMYDRLPYNVEVSIEQLETVLQSISQS